jgi:Disintegrin
MQGGQAGSVNTSCLVDPDSQRTISLQMCGNGIVEAGEDCDPGIGTTSNCCDSATCKFINNAECDPQSSPCCNAQCTFAPSTQVCRPSIDPKCDTAEFCTGNSSSCPADVTAKNGTKISNKPGLVADMISIVIIKVRAVGVTVWHVLVVNVRLSPVSRPCSY